MPDHPPPEFRYTGLACDFPAKAALERVLGHFIDVKRGAMAESDVYLAVAEGNLGVLDEFEGREAADDASPNRDIWLRFRASRDDLVAAARDPEAAAGLGRFEISQADDSSSGVEDDRLWIAIDVHLMLDWTNAAMILRFLPDDASGAIACQCWVHMAEGDGKDLEAAAALLG